MKTFLYKHIAFVFVILLLSSFFLIENSEAQWTQVNYNFYGKAIRSLASSGDTVFAGTAGQGIYVSTNRGANWTQTSMNNQDVYSITISGLNIYAGTWGGVFISTNRGVNWTNTGLSYIRGVAVLGNTIYACNYSSCSGVYLSTNNGTNWVQTALNNQCMYCISVSGNNVISGTDNYSIYLTTNNGISWSTTYTSNPVYSLISSGDTVIAGTRNNGVIHSTNNGVSWTGIGLGNFPIYAFTKYGNYIFAGTGSGVYITTNNGALWTQSINKNTLSLTISGNTIFAGTDNGLYSSTNNGVIWSTPPPPNVGVIKQSGTNLYAGTTDGVYSSTDGGLRWTSKNIVQNINSLLIDGSTVYAGTAGSGVFYTTNDGMNWTQSPAPMNSGTINSLASKGTNILAGTTTNGVYYSTNNGLNWTQSSLNITTNALYVLDSIVYAGTVFGGVYTSSNNGVNWTQTSLMYVDAYSFGYDGSKLYAGIGSNGVYYTTNKGVNWTQTSMTTNTPVSFSTYSSSVFAGTNGAGVYVTRNGGTNWTQSNDGMGTQNVRTLITYGNYIIAGTGGNSFWRRYILEFAPIRGDANLDSTVNVLDVTSTVNYILGNPPVPFSTLAADVNSDALINVLDVVGEVNIILHPAYKSFANNENHDNFGSANLFIQNDNLKLTNTVPVSAIQYRLSGANAQNVTFTPSSELIHHQTVSGSAGDTSKTFVIFTITDSNLTTGVHTLGTFSGLNNGITIKDIVIADGSGNGIITGTEGNENSIIPNEFILNQNYPNPFNPVTLINFAIPKPGFTSLKVYDVTGKLIKTLISDYRQAGYYNVEFDAGSLSSGVYFYRLSSGSYSAAKKMLLIK